MNAHPHDTYFRRVFARTENAAALLATVFSPEVGELFDLTSLELAPGCFVDEELTPRYTDLLFTAKVRGAKTRAFILLEHQSTLDPLLAIRLLSYAAEVWDDWMRENPRARKLPVLVAVAVSHGAVFTGSLSVHGLLNLSPEVLALFGDYLPDFTFFLDDLEAQSRETVRSRPIPPVACVALSLLRDLRKVREDAEGIGRLLRDLEDLIARVDDRSWISYILDVVEIDAREAQALISRTIQSAKESTVTAADQLRQQGREQGLAEGKTETLRSVLHLLAAKRFGALDAEAEARIQGADAPRLERWVDAVLTAPSLRALLAIG